MPEGFEITVRREIAASPEELFDAWLDPESLGTWLKPGGIRETRAETDPREGGQFRIVMVEDESSSVHSGTYRVIDRPRRLVFTWASRATQFRDSIVTVTFEPSGAGTVVEIHQIGLPSKEEQGWHRSGWTDALGELDQAIRAQRKG